MKERKKIKKKLKELEKALPIFGTIDPDGEMTGYQTRTGKYFIHFKGIQDGIFEEWIEEFSHDEIMEILEDTKENEKRIIDLCASKDDENFGGVLFN